MRLANLKTILGGVFLIDANEAEAYLPLVQNILTKGGVPNDVKFETRAPSLISAQGDSYDHVADLPQNQKAVAVGYLNDVIMKYDDGCGLIGTETHAQFLRSCYANDSIAGVVFEVDSPGGAADAVENLSKTIAERNKPVLFHVNGLMASAAYWIASHGDEIHSDMEGSRIGSIGAIWTLMNADGMYEDAGIKITRLYADQSENKIKAFREWLEDGKTGLLQKELNECAQDFIDTVHANRGIAKDSEVMTGHIYKSKEAMSFGLIDGTLTLAETIERCMELSEGYEAPKSKNQNEKEMFGKKNNSFKALAAFAETSAEERTKEQLEAVNAELQEAGIDAVLAKPDLEATLNGKVESLSAKVTTLESAKTDVEGKLKAEKEAKEAAEASLGKVKAVFGKDAEAEDFDLEASVTTLKEERDEFAAKVPGGAQPKKEVGDDMGDEEIELSEVEAKMRKEAEEY